MRDEAERLAAASAWAGCPAGGWQFPFELGDGFVTRTYNPHQARVHPWRRQVLLANLDKLFAGRYGQISVLDLGACEGAMSEGLWQRGVRDITLVEARPINVTKAKFVAKVKGYDFHFVQAPLEDFLASEKKTYDVVLLLATLQTLLNPFGVSRQIARCTGQLAVYDTTVAVAENITIRNAANSGTPSSAAFFLRSFSPEATTAGLRDLELWPTRDALELLVKESGFRRTWEADYGRDPDPWYTSGEWVMLFAEK